MVHAPVNVITVEREYGSHGGEFAHDLAAHLGWRLLDSELVTGAAHMAGVDPKLAAKFDERLDPWYYRYGKDLLARSGVCAGDHRGEKIFDSERMLELIKQEILDAAKQGNCVLVGRGSACALAGKPGCFHVFVYATAERQERLVCACISGAGAARRAGSGGIRQAPRGGDSQVLPAGVVLARPLPHAAQLLRRH